MFKIVFKLLLGVFLVNVTAFAGDPLSPCRVEKETLKKYGHLHGNAGCIISKKEKNRTKMLLVYVDDSDPRGWALPGGTNSNRTKDMQLGANKKPLSAVTYAVGKNARTDYAEPAVCTASRETKEEIGKDVIVGRMIENGKFIVFECFLTDPKDYDRVLQPLDKSEVTKTGWFTIGDMKKKGFSRYQSNIPIAEKFLQGRK